MSDDTSTLAYNKTPRTALGLVKSNSMVALRGWKEGKEENHQAQTWEDRVSGRGYSYDLWNS